MIMHILKSKAMERCLPAILSGMLLAACSVAEPPREQLSVSIEPLNFLTRQIAGDDFEINVLVPPAASPETYEPTPAQMKRVANSAAYIEIGLLDFEHNLERSIRENMSGVRIVRTADSVPVLTGGHGHGHDGHGTDPHIWTSPRNLRVMAATLLSQLESMYPDSTATERTTNVSRTAWIRSTTHCKRYSPTVPAPSSFTIRPFPTWPAITV